MAGDCARRLAVNLSKTIGTPEAVPSEFTKNSPTLSD